MIEKIVQDKDIETYTSYTGFPLCHGLLILPISLGCTTLLYHSTNFCFLPDKHGCPDAAWIAARR